MMNQAKRTLTLDQPATYQIKVPGHLDTQWLEWNGSVTIATACDEDGSPFTTLTGTVDQAALHGLLRRLYALGLPLFSVICLDYY
jgi:hypothetical protein